MSNYKTQRKICVGNERGVVVVLIAILMIVFVGFIALAIDINHLYVVRNELQNAADAGALAGAHALYKNVPGYKDGERVNENANAIAKETGVKNLSDASSVEIDWTSGNTGDVQRGHWSFSNDKFTPLDTLEPVALWGVPSEELDKMDGTYEYPPGEKWEHVNAVRVVARRNDIEAESFFAGIYGFFGFKMQADAVAYIGFAGSLGPLEMDVPIAICNTSLDNGDCNIGRMINSADKATSNTAAWVDANPLSNEAACQGGTNAKILGDQIGDKNDLGGNTACGCINPDYNSEEECGVNNGEINGSTWLEAIGGQVSSGYMPMQGCFEDHLPNQPWEMTLPVVKCDGGQVEGCLDVDGAVTVNMVFMADNSSPSEADTPYEMTKPGADNFPDWYAKIYPNGDPSADCSFFYQLAGVDSNENPITPYYNAALLPGNSSYNSVGLSDNLQSTVLKYLPGTEFVEEEGVVYITDDPWKVAVPESEGQRWDGYDSDKVYSADMARWDCFTSHFNLKHQDGTYAPFQAKALYFLPDCEYHEPKGTSSDENFGILAEYPVLVD